MLNDAITNASGIVQGGQDSKGYYDHFLIRGLNAQVKVAFEVLPP
jgi:iron complex outermembrane recepter protein